MLSAYQAADPYSQYDVDQYEKQSVSSSSSSSASFGNVAVSGKLSNTNRQVDQEENQKTREKPPKRKSFRRIFGQNEKEEKEEKKVKEKKTISLSLFSKDKTGKNEKNEKHERNENERLRPTPNHSNSGEKRKNRLSYIFFSDEDVKKDNLTPKDDVPQKKRSNSNSSSLTLSENEDGPEKSKNKSNKNRLSKFFVSEEDRKKGLSTNHNNFSDLFIAGNETPIKSHNRSILINNENLVELLSTNTSRPISLVSSNTGDSDNADTNHNNLSDLHITGSETPRKSHSHTILINDENLVELLSTNTSRPISLVSSNTGDSDNAETKENHQDYTESINEGIDHRDGPKIIGVDENNQDYSEIADKDKINNGFAGDDQDHQDDEIPIKDTIHENDQDYSVIADENKNSEFVSNDQNHQDDEITNRDINHQSDIEITENNQNDAKTTANHHIETEVTDGNMDIIKDNVRQGYYTEVSNVDVGHQDYADHVSTKVTGDDVKSNNEEDENNQDHIHKIPNDNDDTYIRNNSLASNHHDESEHPTPSSPASFSPIPTDVTQSVAINPEFNRKRDYRNEEEDRDVRVIEKNRFYEVKKIVEKYQVPKIIEKHVIVTKEDPQTRQEIEQLQATNENLVSVNTQLESKIKEQSQQIEKFSSLESVMVRQAQLVERMEETIRRLETQVQDQKEEIGVRISEHMEDTVRQLEGKLNEKSKELDNLRTVMMDQLQTQTPPLYLSPVQMVGTIDINGMLPASENPSINTSAVTAMTMAMTTTTRQEPQEMYSRNTLVNTLVVKPLVNTIVVSASIATSVLYAVYIRPVIGLVKVVKSGV